MAIFTVRKELLAHPVVVWNVLADFGEVWWIPPSGNVEVEGSGPGMRRTIHGSGGPPVVERLLWSSPELQSMAYEIEQNNPLPVSRFLTEVTVTEGAVSTVTWRVYFEANSDEDPHAIRLGIDATYTAIASWLQDAALAVA